ncbi:hypothetical protein H2248_008139 [Termitomyces sp. 'cryptogamus']|nr:hypothetical protein H2248_008139 [Termitomyces sp. 'cryptogamus']
MLKCTRDDGECTIKAADKADILNVVYEEKYMDYNAHVMMPSSEFMCIVQDLSLLGKSVQIKVLKEGVCFISNGKAANGSILLCQSDMSAIRKVNKLKKPKKKKNTKGAKVVDVNADKEKKEQASDGKNSTGTPPTPTLQDGLKPSRSTFSC